MTDVGSAVTVRVRRGICNRLFQYATGRSLSSRLGCPLPLDASSLATKDGRVIVRAVALGEFSHEGTLVWDSKRNRGRVSRLLIRVGLVGGRRRVDASVFHAKSIAFDAAVLELPLGAALDGCFQSERYFGDVSESVAHEITELARRSDLLVRELADGAPGPRDVPVHVRLGDHMTPQSTSHRGLPSAAYYERALEAMDGYASVGAAWIFSDDPDAAEDLAQTRGYEASALPPPHAERPLESLTLVSRFRRLIRANSSCSGWAAWLACRVVGSAVIAPDPWFRDASLDDRDIVSTQWIRMDHRWRDE